VKNIQIIDGADHATFSVFRATDEEFDYLFPAQGQDIEVIEDFFARHHETFAAETLGKLWERPIHKRDAHGIHGTLFYDHEDKRHHLPSSKREIDQDPSQINAAERELYTRLQAAEPADGYSPLPETTAAFLGEIPGGSQLLEWFGYAPRFHDAEVLTVTLDREGPRCTIAIHGFEMTPEVDSDGYFILTKHVVVSFHLEGVSLLELGGFAEQNYLMGLSLSRTGDGQFRLELDPCGGLGGCVEARAMSIAIEPGKP
jgi:hypothetical protein